MTSPGDAPSEGRWRPPGRGRTPPRPLPPPSGRADADPPSAAPACPLFSPSPLFSALRDLVLPSLGADGWPRIWVAGCGSGEETWSLAICLRDVGLLSHARVYATDADGAAIPRARRGRIAAADLAASEDGYREAGGEGGLARHLRVDPRGASVDPALGERIVFARHDASRDAPFHLFDLVLWRASLARPAVPVDSDAMRRLDECCLPGGWLAFRSGEEPEPRSVVRYLRPVPGLPLYRKSTA